MKESNITPKVIELAKQISEHWRMEIYGGCWVIDEKEVPLLINNSHDVEWVKHRFPHIPIPSISDVLRKLRELGVSVALQDHILLTYAVGIMDESNEYKPCATESSPHEALLSALLEVLKNSVA